MVVIHAGVRRPASTKVRSLAPGEDPSEVVCGKRDWARRAELSPLYWWWVQTVVCARLDRPDDADLEGEEGGGRREEKGEMQ